WTSRAGLSKKNAVTQSARTNWQTSLTRPETPSDLFLVTLRKSSTKPSPAVKRIVKIQSQTKLLSGLAHIIVATTTDPIRNTPPIVGVPLLAPCNSERRCTSSALRIGWPNFNNASFRITQSPNTRHKRKAVIAAHTARKETYWKTLN